MKSIATVVIEGALSCPVFLTCEHARETMPAPWAFRGEDLRLIGTHWAFDAGAEEITYELAQALEAPAVLANFSRLLCDPNRAEDDVTIFRDVADGQVILLNKNIHEIDREERLSKFYRPFHEEIDRQIVKSNAQVILSIHTFTPVYEGQVRNMEIGVLFDEEESLAKELSNLLSRNCFHTRMNEPYSGREGLIYSAHHHATKHQRKALELEVRSDCALDKDFRKRLIPVISDFCALL